MENLNFQLARIEANLIQLLEGIPIGVAYFLLKAKVNELEKEYYNQAQKEYAAAAQQKPQTQVEEQSQTQTEE